MHNINAIAAWTAAFVDDSRMSAKTKAAFQIKTGALQEAVFGFMLGYFYTFFLHTFDLIVWYSFNDATRALLQEAANIKETDIYDAQSLIVTQQVCFIFFCQFLIIYKNK